MYHKKCQNRNRDFTSDMSEKFTKPRKICIIGSETSGQYALAVRWCFNKYDPNYVLTPGVDQFRGVVVMNKTRYPLIITNMGSKSDKEGYNRNLVAEADLIILCYNYCVRASFNEMTKFWGRVIEARRTQPKILIVGTEGDGSVRNAAREIEDPEAQALIKKRFDCKHMSCNIKENIGVANVFKEAVMFMNEEEGGCCNVA